MNAPTELTELDQWVTWNYQGSDKRKVPYNARTGYTASSTDAASWSDFTEACAAAERRKHAGVGFVFSDYDPYVGVDLDDSLGENGAPLPWAAPIIAALDSYTEVSPSGKGVKVWVRGEVPQNLKTARIEIYKHKRYFTVTGRHLDGTPTEIRDSSAALVGLYERVRQMRETERRRAYVDAAFRREVERVRQAGEASHSRNNQLFASAAALAGFVKSGELDEQTVRDALAGASTANGLSRTEVDQTLDSAFKRAEAREVPADKDPPLAASLVPTKQAPPAKPVGKVNYVVADWRQGGITAAELFNKHFDPLIWTVENIIPESTTLLAGKPKSKKSWFALGVGVAVAMGHPALGRLGVRQGRVLYLDLESNQRRAKSRMFSIAGRAMEKLTNLHIFTKWPRGEDAIRALEEWMLAYPDTVLIVIDVLADFRRGKDPKEDAYLYDRETVGPITEFADRHRISVLMVHHTRKAKADDVFDEISGSTGLISAVGTALILGRAPNGSSEMVLDLRGRDLINDDPLALTWDDYSCQHVIVGGAVDAKLGAERRAVLKVLSDDQPWTPREIATELEKPVNNVQQMLKVLLSEGMVERTGRGQYVRVLSRDQNDQNDQNHKNVQDAQSGRGSDSDLVRQDQNQDQNGLRRQDAADSLSDHSDRVSLVHTVDRFGMLWRVWNPGRTEVVCFFRTEAEARAEAERLNGGAA